MAENRVPRVMISYAREDRRYLEGVCAALEAEGIETWWDGAIAPGANWDAEIERALAEVDAVLVLWTPRSVGRDTVRNEADDARSRRKLLPLIMEPCKPPLFFRLAQAVDLSDWTGDTSDPEWRRVLDRIAADRPPDGAPGNDLGRDATHEISPQFSEPIRARFARLDRIVERLTEEQFDVLRILGTTRRVRIAGCAGSGKTLVACEKAIRCARAGLRVLFLSHSPHLAGHVSALTSGSGVMVADFTSWLMSVMGLEPSEQSKRWLNIEEPDEQTLEQAFDVVLESQTFDVVVVDEGQDFRETWWLLVEAALDQGTRSQLYIFHDDNQALLPFRASYPFDDPMLNLSRNCRNAGRVFEVIRRFHAQAPDPEAALANQGMLAYFRAEPAQRDVAIDRCLGCLKEQGALLEDRVLLLAGGLEKTPLVETHVEARGETVQRWQDIVRHQLERAVTTYVRRGIVTPRDVALKHLEALSALGTGSRPGPEDVALVVSAARSIELDAKLCRQIGGGNEAGLDLAWTLVDGTPRFRRALGGRLHGVEVLRFFSDPGWATGLPETHRWQFITEAVPNGAAETVPVFDIAAFKGLESDTVILLLGDHQPVGREKLYVALSRARQVLAIVDCSGGLTSTVALRKVDFDIFETVRSGA
ncbi:TIR domain-containing protein [Salipiger mucosus]|uniref:TIR domain-containing protein n=1 Tax=Salipiger mucosus DSM 16094 TaxID=1123237 RepID=S9QV33_9RHOB|nr:TIR domain-containing protein [Salipiger mucosus]EPX85251.1 hypothetical protein Salmuc_02630 [Salipiger mucosus DSM 16094]